MRLILLAALLVVGYCASADPNTFSNYLDVQLQHVHIEWYLNVDKAYANCTAQYDFVVKSNGLTEIYLDIYQLDVSFVYLPDNGQILQFEVHSVQQQSLIQGDRLVITLPRAYRTGEFIRLKIKYALDERARALNFLTKEQTGGKTQPYVFSQCEDANCRSLIPLQDTPAVKHTYSATILTRPEITVFMSGNQTSLSRNSLFEDYPELLRENPSNQWRITQFETTIPFQSYLIAIIAGDVVQKQVGPRTYVISEPIYIDSYAQELSDLESYLTDLENYIGPYMWGDYKIVIQPPSFPIGGMENPLLTFASPSIIVGDKSGVSVAIHEQAHSWTGNTVTCKDWSNFWINEGFDVFLERKIVKQVYGEDYYKIDAYDGNSGLLDDINGFGEDESYSSLFPNTAGKNPDDSFSTVPYEKGFQFLTFLESFIGEEDMQKMLQAFIINFRYQSIDQDQVRLFFQGWLQKNKKPEDALVCIKKMNDNWDTWVKKPGKPPIQLDFYTQKIGDAQKLAQAYIDGNGKQPSNWKDFQSYLTPQKYIFLQYLSDNKGKLNQDIIVRIDQDQNLSKNSNKEILWRWFRSCLQARYTANIEDVHKFLGSIGRMKMIAPVYTELNIVNHDLAVKYFQEYFNFYHPIARNKIASIINSKFQNVIAY